MSAARLIITGGTNDHGRRRRGPAVWVLASLASLLVVLGGAAPAHATVGDATLVSHTATSPTTAANGASALAGPTADAAAISADAKFVVFSSAATDLVTGQTDTNAGNDVFLLERATGTVTLVSHVPGSPTTTGNVSSGFPVMSADAAFVVFDSAATNLVTGQTDANGGRDAFIWERATGTVTLVSHTPAGPTTAANSASFLPIISGDGAVVAFESVATDLVTGETDTNGTFDLFVFERATGTVSLVSHLPASLTTGNFDSIAPSISADGAFVAFGSSANNLVTGQIGSNPSDVFLFERATGTVTLVSHVPGSPLTVGDHSSGSPKISADGAVIAFDSFATNLVTGQTDTNNFYDVFTSSRATGTVTLVSHIAGSTTTTGDVATTNQSISTDGGVIALFSTASNLVTGQVDSPSTLDDFVWVGATGTITLVSHAAGSPSTATGVNAFLTFAPVVSADGAFVTFDSAATNLVTGQTDANAATDVFLFERATGTVSLVSHVAGSTTTTANGTSARQVISADGSFVAFDSDATNLAVGQTDTNAATDVFVSGPAAPPVVGGVDVCVKVKTDWRAPDRNNLCPSGFARHHIATTTTGGVPVCVKTDQDWRAPDRNDLCPSGWTRYQISTTVAGGVPVCTKTDLDWRAPYEDGTCPSGYTLRRVVEGLPG